MAASEPIEVRAVLALLANADTRAVFAEVVAADVPAGEARERALRKLLAAGLLETGPDGRPVVAEGRLRATLTQSAPPPVVGAERFLSRAGRILDYPARRADREELLALVLARSVQAGEELNEKELGARLGRHTDDVATLRRYLVDAGLLRRSPDGRSYRLAEPPAVGED
ncbi:MAG: DUF2087 domain-containing protein [Actinobacteria bacterium]|nr:DUF2087 domain-containing protein [Actinomycetota bacterium]